MKNVILLIILLFGVAGCEMGLEETYMTQEEYLLSKVREPRSLYYETWMDKCVNTKRTSYKVRSKIVGLNENPKDIWQSPEETLSILTGDCEDSAILFMNCYYFGTGEKADLCFVWLKEGLHAIVFYEGTFFDPRTGKEYEPAPYRYSFDDVFNTH